MREWPPSIVPSAVADKYQQFLYQSSSSHVCRIHGFLSHCIADKSPNFQVSACTYPCFWAEAQPKSSQVKSRQGIHATVQSKVHITARRKKRKSRTLLLHLDLTRRHSHHVPPIYTHRHRNLKSASRMDGYAGLGCGLAAGFIGRGLSRGLKRGGRLWGGGWACDLLWAGKGVFLWLLGEGERM
ncbi:hypothetical protein P153DRAFT_131003 [Dothidotthia symphoricarpi CBS 119687]|uniref:Uncharacterized protein n=1 Tax=Dothidotthia symphoricarpi CBS 119687 TaxID=1392245 RepID=A0A6A5ZZD8_9PLEO|nr:uncharacterized protein P153DRAFT_131003 [Dothidotthia symphoricarpi CBS 119687]KAF2124385.1 hypothetical protein P153DRAFT_131003 [Dothidotthia symphoricarpi CBS 119687]